VTELINDPSTAWAAVLILLLPVVIIGAGEVEEQLRQQDSPLQRPVGILRTWVVPLFVAWIVTRTLFGLGDDNPVVIVLGSGLVVAIAAAVLTTLAIILEAISSRPRAPGKRAVPRLLLAMPRVLVLLTAGWLLLSGVWNIDLSAALTALGVTSLVVSFALQDPLSSLASGFLLVADQPFQPGDWIQIDDVEGRVTDVNWRTTRIETRNGDLLVVPNGTLANANVVNLDQPTRLHRVVVPVQVAYSNSPTRAKDMLVAAARATPGVVADPPPVAQVVQIDDPLMGYVVHLWIDDYARAPAVTSDFGSLVWYFSHRHGVPLPSPAQDLYLYDGAQVALDERVGRGELLQRLRRAPLLDELDDDDLDVLADAAEPRRYARGEVITAEGDDRDIHVLSEGHAALVLRGDRRAGLDAAQESSREDLVVLDVGSGDIFVPLDPPNTGGLLPVLVAVEDCDVVSIAEAAASQVISRRPNVAAAIDQLGASRRRRIAHALRRSTNALHLGSDEDLDGPGGAGDDGGRPSRPDVGPQQSQARG
jgi:small-conductance mechanosensitive channel